MTDLLLEALPAEVLCRIAEFLHSSHGRHLGAFALASSTCQIAADSSLFRSLNLKAPRSEPLKNLFIVANQILHRRAAHKYVRNLRVALARGPEAWDKPLPEPDHLGLIDNDDVFVEKWQEERFKPRYRIHHLKWDEKEILPTLELNTLVKRLSYLRNLYYDLPWEFAYSTLEVLESRAPSCRLHLYNFRFRQDLRENDRDPPELRLLTSPLLHSIESVSCGYAPYGEGDFTQEAIFDLVNRLNPSLIHVSMLTEVHVHSESLVARAISNRKSRGVWAGLQPKTATPNAPRAKLRSFKIDAGLPPWPEWFRKLADECDLTALETLKLGMPYNDSALGILASSAKFLALSTLVLNFQDFGLPYDNQEDTAVAFLTSLKPLENLRFISEIDADLYNVTLSHHGSSLRRLWFPLPKRKLFERFFIQARLDKLSKSCPVLEDLAIPIARTKGDEREVAMYRTLGSLPMLKKLALTLDCEDTSLTLRVGDRSPPPPDPSFDQYEMEETDGPHGGTAGEMWTVRRGDVREAMVNAALDEKLARSIFAKLQSGKPEGSRPLEHLELRPERGCYTHQSDDIIRELGRWWLVTQKPRVGGPNEITASRLRDYADQAIKDYGPLRLSQLGEMEPIFRRVWPQNAESDSNSTAEWYSWPLAD